jgi:hypothetical protein
MRAQLELDRWVPAAGAARSKDLLRAAKLEGVALRRSLGNPVVRAWAGDAIDGWERRLERLLEREVPAYAAARGGPILAAGLDGRIGFGPGAETTWLESRLDRRIAQLERLIAEQEA